ncbi:tumor necrosis factor receptor superfamily member 21 isoform X1 [Fundulus heteroclitus]|uniref:tumor necrosis factor receptor superfamily member 21 isoform X1 n=1 Tax=Fundulus heteroclitus TaxID=8078 RepID=UPI00165B68A9|nr:tumor necrosis factor receptor superfamily member 21 isoform X1 [Fundulus heteroclitus]
MMPVIHVSAALLCMLVADISARVLTTSATDDQPLLSPRHYQHTDRDSGTQMVCDKCPAGTYVSVHCSPTTVRECSPCPEGTFTRGENGVQQCHRCRSPCPAGLVEKVPCTATQDRVCTCPPNRFLSRDSGVECKPYSLCPPGTRVKKRGTQTEDVLCKPCTKGTFSREASSAASCRNHTDCQALGMLLLTPGTRQTDNVCGPPSTTSSSVTPTTPLGPAQAVFLQQSMTSSVTPSLNVPAHKGSLSQSAAIQLRGTVGGGNRGEELVLTHSGISITPNQDASWTSLSMARKQAVDLKQELDESTAESEPRGTKPSMEGPEGPEVVRVGTSISNVASPGNGGPASSYYRPNRRGSPRPTRHDHFDINEHLPWMIVLLLLLVLVVIVMCSVKRSSRVLKKGPMQDPSSIVEKAIHKKPAVPATQAREKWMYYYSNGQGVDILKLVAAQVGNQWIDIYQSLANATEREVAAFSNGYSSDHERAYAALQHWTIRDSGANLAKLINALHRQRRIDVVEKIRCIMEDNPQFDINQLTTTVNVSQSLSPIHKLLDSPSGTGGSGGSSGRTSGAVSVQSPMDRTKCFFADESEPLLRCDSTSSKDSALSRNGSFITKEKKDTVLRQVRLDPCDLQPIFDDMLHILNPEELRFLEEIPTAADKLDRLFEIAGVKSQEASQTLLDSVYSHLPDLL